MATQVEKLVGTLARSGGRNGDGIIYHDPKRGFAIFLLEVDDGEGGRRRVTVKGHVSDLSQGVEYHCTGKTVKHPKFGKQFDAADIEVVRPDLSDGGNMADYLGSGIVEGISSGLGRKLAEHFGDETIRVLSADWERLTEVKGISERLAQQFHRAWIEHQAVFESLSFLKRHGLGNSDAIKAMAYFGESAIDYVKENPYALTEVQGIGFPTADKVAESLGFGDEHPFRIESGLLYRVREVAKRGGHTRLDRDDLVAGAAHLLGLKKSLVESRIDDLLSRGVLVEYQDGGVADALLARAEENIARRLGDLLEGEPFGGRHLEIPDTSEFPYSDDQIEAFRIFSRSKVMIITGGPGTGKSTILKGCLEMVSRAGIASVRLMAPTGRAADRMTEATGRHASTIHRGLEYNPNEGFMRNADNPLAADLVVIDEASMTDTHLASSLLDAIPPSASLLIVGDVDQLPSVGPGAVLKDLIESGRIPTARLTTGHRFAGQIAEVATNIRDGCLPDLQPRCDNRFFFLKCPAASIPDKIVALATKELLPYAKRYEFDAGLVQILTPKWEGASGVNNLNVLLQEAINPQGVGNEMKPEITRGARAYRVGDRVMQLENDYDLGIWNGDVGRVLDANPGNRNLLVDFGRTTVTLSDEQLNKIDLAYASTIHKSQGSEYPCVVTVVSPEHRFMLARNLIYTAHTRAKTLSVMVGSPDALRRAIDQVEAESRNTGLREWIAAYAPDLDDRLEAMAQAADHAIGY